jgi:hypothetical protein
MNYVLLYQVIPASTASLGITMNPADDIPNDPFPTK